MADKTLYSSFSSPGPEFRAAPFWAWNGKLEPRELQRQVGLFQDGGVGGFLVHARYGLETPYLSEDWFRAVRTALEEARKRDLRVWLYDEDRWPSGSAGGMISKEHPEFRQHALHYIVCKGGVVPSNAPLLREFPLVRGEKVREGIWSDKRLVGLFLAKIDGVKASDVRQVPRGDAIRAEEGDSVVLCLDLPDEPDGWHNGGTYIDPMNAEATRAFLAKTHEAYFKRFGKDFGKLIPGIFTDEPSFKNGITSDPWSPGKGEQCAHHQIAWTPRLPVIFEEAFRFDLRPRLLELVYDVDGAGKSPARYLFRELLTRLFVENYIAVIGKWCGEHGFESTGHVLGEDTPATQSSTVGSCMRCYEHMQRPGIDQLCEDWRAFVPAKQLSSAARQFGKKWRLTETYGCTGWDFPFAGFKALGDYQVALGVNFRVPHLSWYTMQGGAKRDYPGSIFHQATWWDQFHRLEDYFARIHTVVTRGEEVRDLLVIHPNETQWTFCRAGWQLDGPAYLFDHDFENLSTALLARHLDFDYGDEEILSRLATVVRPGDGTPRVVVGRASYKAVVVPSVRTLRRTTFDLLGRFRAAGGLVVFQGELPVLMDGADDEEATRLASSYPKITDPDELARRLAPLARRVSIADAATGREFPSALYLLREDADNHYLFLCNTGEPVDGGVLYKGVSMTSFVHRVRERTASCDDVVLGLDAPSGGNPVELDPLTGSRRDVPAKRSKDGRLLFRTSLAPLESRLYVIPKNAALADIPEPPRTIVARSLPVPGPFRRELSEANVLVLDHPRYKIGDGEWQDETEILRIDGAVHKALGIPPFDAMGVQPWATPRPADPRHLPVKLRYTFDSDILPGGTIHLAIERPGRFGISLNGTPLQASQDDGWWVDPSLRRLRAPAGSIVKGRNELLLSLEYDELFSGLEIVYLLGEFGVEIRGTDRPALISSQNEIRAGDWCGQGLPFYSGNVTYSRTQKLSLGEGERAFLRLGDFRGAAARILVDGTETAFLVSPPYEADLTAPFADGEPHRLSIEILGSRRNSHGPFHWDERWPGWQGPEKFLYDKDHWSDAYMLVPCGLLEQPVFEIRKERNPSFAG